MSLLGSLILAGTENIHLVGDVLQILRSPADFYMPKHAALYESLVELFDQHQAIDLVQLQQKLRDRQQYDQIGGVDYLISLAEAVPTAVNAPHYARIVRDKSRLRHLIDAAARILRDAHESSEPPNLILDMAEKRIFEIAQAAQTDKPTRLADLVRETFEQLEMRRDSGRTLTGISSGYMQLDEMLNGLQPGEMIILAARPSMGKTALALNIAENVALTNGQPVAVFSLEMSKQQLSERLLSSAAGVDGQRMRRNLIGEDEIQRLLEAAGDLSKAPMFIDDAPSLSVLGLRSKARRLEREQGIRLIVVDYLQLMTSPGSESRVQEVGEISRGIKALARELMVPILCLSQLNRNPEGRESKRPMLSDLRESGSIEQDADVVMMLHREEYYHNDEKWRMENPDKLGASDLIIAKQRNGPTGTVPLQFNHRTTRFGPRAAGSQGEDGF